MKILLFGKDGQVGWELQRNLESIGEFPALAYRPQNSRLDTGKLQNIFGLNPPDWQRGSTPMLAEIPEKQS
ncbi:MAG: sugar nucleotide-binding protein [Methylobacter tundripaludum]|nr:sugar nucleotide-binding protein [Methylobacter tundripaludum]